MRLTAVMLPQLLGENPAKIVNFAGYLRNVFRTDTDPTTLEVAAATLGHLVQAGGALTADVVEFEVRPAFRCGCHTASETCTGQGEWGHMPHVKCHNRVTLHISCTSQTCADHHVAHLSALSQH